MKCPHCEYQHGFDWNGDEYVDTKGKKGEFFELLIETMRYASDGETERMTAYACPSCGKLFIDL